MSAKGAAFRIVGCLPYGEAPAFALPLFEISDDGNLRIQIVDEYSGLITKFEELDLSNDRIVGVKAGRRFRVGASPAITFVTREGRVVAGALPDVADEIKARSDAFGNPALRIQVAELCDDVDRLRKARVDLGKSLVGGSLRSGAQAYQTSAATRLVWEALIKASESESIARNFISNRHKIRVIIGIDWSINFKNDGINLERFPQFDRNNAFQRIQDEIIKPIRESISLEPDEEEFMPDGINYQTIRDFLDAKLGSDARISEYSYRAAARMVSELGIHSISDLSRTIDGQDGVDLGYMAYQTRQGQITKFELMLLSALERKFIEYKAMSSGVWWGDHYRDILERVRAAQESLI